MNSLRAVFRLSRVAVHLCYGAAVVVLVFPFIRHGGRRALKRRWSAQLVGMLGLRLIGRQGAVLRGLVVANHISWLDIFVINAMHPVAFVAKDDVEAWPLIGWLAATNETVFLERGSRRAAHAAGQRVAAMLAQGAAVAVFPEGTTTEGDQVLPFRGALLQGAVEAGTQVQPLALRYVCRAGRRSAAPAYCGDTSLLSSLWQIVCASGLTAVCVPLPPVSADGRDRRELAAACAASIEAALGLAQQHQGPGRDDVDQRDEHGGTADVLGPLGEAVAFE
ncbi:MAG: lysophospholipid acyltransferase family protein [Ignavibacteria bacterium]